MSGLSDVFRNTFCLERHRQLSVREEACFNKNRDKGNSILKIWKGIFVLGAHILPPPSGNVKPKRNENMWRLEVFLTGYLKEGLK